jgi:hypothetical protein
MAIKGIRFIVLSGIAVVLAGLFTTMSLQEILAQETRNKQQHRPI